MNKDQVSQVLALLSRLQGVSAPIADTMSKKDMVEAVMAMGDIVKARLDKGEVLSAPSETPTPPTGPKKPLRERFFQKLQEGGMDIGEFSQKDLQFLNIVRGKEKKEVRVWFEWVYYSGHERRHCHALIGEIRNIMVDFGYDVKIVTPGGNNPSYLSIITK